jgi:hypothetical protein
MKNWLKSVFVVIAIVSVTGVFVSCSSNSLPTNPQSADEMAAKAKPYLELGGNGKLVLRQEAENQLDEETLDFANKSIEKSNKLVDQGYSFDSDFKLNAKNTNMNTVRPLAWNQWEYNGWKSGCGPMYTYKWYNWYAVYTLMDHCNVVDLIDFGARPWMNAVMAVLGPYGALYYGYIAWYDAADRGNGVQITQPWALPIQYIYSR